MMNVRVGGMKEKGNEKKCSVPASSARNEEKQENMTYNRTTTTSISPSSSTTFSSFANVPTSRIIKRPRRMKFLSLSPPSSSPQLDQIENCSPAHPINFQIRRGMRPAAAITEASRSVILSAEKEKSGGKDSSSSSYFSFSIRSLATTAPILIPLLLCYIVIVPVSGMSSDILSTYSTPSFLASSSSQMPSSTDRSMLSSNSPEHRTESMHLPLENHHHHPDSSSLPPSSHLVELLSDGPATAANGQQQQQHHHQHQQAFGQPHSCYVCIPPDKNSRDAEEVLSIFPAETREHIPDCASFGSLNANRFEFKCPPEYVGCLLRIHGKNESRSCSKVPVNDCKTANSVELCYCTGALCNINRPEIQLEETESDERARSQLDEEKEERETRKIWQKGETDDEDLLGSHQLDMAADDMEEFGSGSEPPPGVIIQYTSTARPTLIPNIRPDTRTTTPKSVSGAPASITGKLFFSSAFKIPYTSVIIPISIVQLSLVPLILPFIQLRFWDNNSYSL